MSVRPVIWRVDVRIWLDEEARRERRPVTLGSIPSATLDALADVGFGWVWPQGIWDVGVSGREVHSRRVETLDRCADLGLDTDAVVGPPDVPAAYRVPDGMGGDDGLEAFRADLARRDLRILLDFVPGRVALDHPWVEGRPDLLVPGRDEDLARDPSRFWRSPSGRVFARAMDCRGDPLPDALAPNFRHPGLRRAMLSELESVALRADGVRILEPAAADSDFWAEAITRVRAAAPHVILVADGIPVPQGPVASGGFDLVLDHGLPDLLLSEDASAVREHISRPSTTLRFLEAPCGARAATRFAGHLHFPAALLAYFSGGAALFPDGQIDGRKMPECPLVSRRPDEPPDREVRSFYEALLEILGRPEVARGRCDLLRVREAWEGNATWGQFVVLLHRGEAGEALLLAVNFGPERGQCYVDLSSLEPAGREWILQDLLSVAAYARDGNDLASRGLYLDLPAWDYNVFEILGGRAF